MADVNPLKLVDLGSGQGQLREMQAGDKIPGGLLPATEWSADTVSQAEAEAGAATTRRAWTAQRVRQAIVAWWTGATSGFGRGFVAAADAAAGRTALELGNAATATVQTNPYDSTADRVLLVGAQGLGATATLNIPTQADIDNPAFGANGSSYRVTNVIAPGLPPGTYHLTIKRSSGSSASFQEAVGVNIANRKYTRLVQISGATPWVQTLDTGNLTPNVLAAFTLATLPSAAANPRLQVYCSNLTGQPAPVFSDGTNWRRVSDNTIAN